MCKMKPPQYYSLVRKQDTLNQFSNSDGKGCKVKLKIVGIYPEVKTYKLLKHGILMQENLFKNNNWFQCIKIYFKDTITERSFLILH